MPQLRTYLYLTSEALLPRWGGEATTPAWTKDRGDGLNVNGPREADADYGYVGSAPGKVDLYKAKIEIRADDTTGGGSERTGQPHQRQDRWKDPE